MFLRNIGFKRYFLRDINSVIRFLIVSDAIIIGASGLMGPIFAIFIQEFIINGNAEVAGFAAGIYLFTKSIGQIPVAYVIDKIKGEKDDFWIMFCFTIAGSLLPLMYLIIQTPLELYFVQFLLGVCSACVFPSFMAIFTRHIDKKKEGTEWGIYFTLTDLTGAALASLGGYLAISVGFPTLIILISLVSLGGTLLLLPIRKLIKFKRKTL